MPLPAITLHLKNLFQLAFGVYLKGTPKLIYDGEYHFIFISSFCIQCGKKAIH